MPVPHRARGSRRACGSRCVRVDSRARVSLLRYHRPEPYSDSVSAPTSPGLDLLLDGRYRVEDLIARGGMATVHRGHDQRLDRVVALKIMHPHLAMDEDFRRRFAREARAAARLAHRNVVGVFDQGEDGDRIYLAMELVEGQTLRARLGQPEGMSVRETLDVTAQVLEALAAAHEAGIVHRDIKPENVLIDPEGVVKVADFGLARAVGTAQSSASATLLGTVAYISPEVVTRGHCDERSDLYSLGVMVFEMLTGLQPFRGEQPVHIAFQHVHEDIPAPSSLATAIPSALDSLVTWAAARNVQQRPATAGDLLRAVRELQRTLPPGVLDARPEPRELDSTGEVPRLTVPLTDVVSQISSEARSFPSEMRTQPTSEHGTAGHPADPEGTDGAVPAEPPGPGEGTGPEDLPPRVVALPLPRTRRGRHLPHGTRRRSRPVTALASLLLAGALGVGGWAGVDWYATAGPGGDRSVPVLAGTQLSDAEAALASADLSTRTEERFSDTVPAGHVISSSPSTGTIVKRGTDVQVIVSKGQQTFPVPSLEGMGVEEARQAVEEQGLALVEDEPSYSETVPEGHVISQSSEAEALPAGGEVHVVLSQGREPITVPDQRGRGGSDARAALEAAGFEVSSAQAHSGSVPKGAVISQDPASGTLHRGDTVRIVTSLGPEMVTVPDVFRQSEADAKATLEAAGFTVSVQHDRGEPVFGLVYEQSAAAGSELAKGSTVTITVF